MFVVAFSTPYLEQFIIAFCSPRRRIVLSNQNIGKLNNILYFGCQLALFAFTFYSPNRS